jgi:hypothetical protein
MENKDFPVNSMGWWLLKIANLKIRRLALQNTSKYRLKIIFPDITSVNEAISKAFSWKGTPQGRDFWMKIFGDTDIDISKIYTIDEVINYIKQSY